MIFSLSTLLRGKNAFAENRCINITAGASTNEMLGRLVIPSNKDKDNNNGKRQLPIVGHDVYGLNSTRYITQGKNLFKINT